MRKLTNVFLSSLLLLVVGLTYAHAHDGDPASTKIWGVPNGAEGTIAPVLTLQLLGYFDVVLVNRPLTAAEEASTNPHYRRFLSGSIIAYQTDGSGRLILPPVDSSTAGEHFCFLSTAPERGFIKPDETNFIRLNDVRYRECHPGDVDAGETCTSNATCNGGGGEGTGTCIGSTIQTADLAGADTQLCLYHPRDLFWADYSGEQDLWEVTP